MNFIKKQPKEPASEPKIVHKRHTRAAAKKAALLGSVTIEPVAARAARPSLLMFTMLVVYKSLYVLGITILRRRLKFSRRFRKFRHRLWQDFLTWLEITSRRTGRFFMGFIARIQAPFLRIGRTYAEVLPEIRQMRRRGKIPFRAYSSVLESVGRLLFKILSTIFNYTAPVAAAVVFIIVVTRGINEPRVYVIEYRGEIIGYIENESVFTAATQDVQNRVTTDGEGAFPIYEPHSELMTVKQFEQLKNESKIPADAAKLEQGELADKLIQYSGSEVSEAYGLYIDNRFLGALLDKDVVLNEFNRIVAANRTGKPGEKVKIEKSIRLSPGLYPKSSITTDQNVLSVLNSKVNSDQIYIVKTGDTPTGIADKTGVPYAVLKEMNPFIEETLVEGMEIYTQIAAPYLTVSNNYIDVVEEVVPFTTVETQNATYARGFREVYQDGVNGERRVTYQVKVINGLEAERVELLSEMLKAPVEEKVTVGVNNPAVIVSRPSQQDGTGQGTAAVSSRGFIWPVGNSGGYISCGLNGYRGHTGMDIAGAGGQGAPILASASGTVVLARNGWTGYGRHIIIDHGNGYQTLYAHNSQLYVSVGDKVGQGQIIAAMGATGNAYGVHLHFEVRQNGKIQNPVNFVGYR